MFTISFSILHCQKEPNMNASLLAQCLCHESLTHTSAKEWLEARSKKKPNGREIKGKR